MRMNAILDIKHHFLYNKNESGTDYFMGDLHGSYNLFEKLISDLKFDKNKDRVFCVGDLIDRGKDSLKCVMLLNNEWFYSVLGNHEEMLLLSLDSKYIEQLWMKNGGEWWEGMSFEERIGIISLIRKKSSLTATIKTDCGDVGLVHADYFSESWPLELNAISKERVREMLWSRITLSERKYKKIKSVKVVFSGHTPLSKPAVLGNHIFLDTGCGHHPNEIITEPTLTIARLTNSGIEFHMRSQKKYKVSHVNIDN